MLLQKLVNSLTVAEIHGPADGEFAGICFDSRKVTAGMLFVAVRGTTSDGHDYIDAVAKSGACAIVCEELPASISQGVCYIRVISSHQALGEAASAFYGDPSSKLRLIGVTGTNGKTTTATLLYRLFLGLGYGTGLISTIINKVNDKEYPSTHTTPDPVQLNALLSAMVDAGCTYCFMEVSSHAVDQQRIAGLTFEGGIFSNLTHDHLDYHKTFSAYLQAKKRFFDSLGSHAFALVNKDDRNGMVMVQNTRARVKTFSLQSMADFRCRIIEISFNGLLLNLDGEEVWFRMIGRFNASNLLAVYAAAMLLDQDKTHVLSILSNLEPVDGRFNNIRGGNDITAIVDYAHTPDALQNVLETILDIRQPGQQMITVVGAGGNRDTSKRPVMAKISASLSDRLILTSDNPRDEDPEVILEQMRSGVDPAHLSKTLVIVNRKEAIRTACALANPGDIILVAGKGHETYQEIRGVKHHFDDREVLTEILINNNIQNK